MSIKIKTISTVQLPPPKCRKNLFHVVLTKEVTFCGFFFYAKMRLMPRKYQSLICPDVMSAYLYLFLSPVSAFALLAVFPK